MSRTRSFLGPVLGIGVLLAAAAAQAQAPLMALPESPAWQHGRSFVSAYNAGGSAALPRYFASHLSAHAEAQRAGSRRAAALQALRREVGEIEVVEASGVPHALVLSARTRQGEALDIVLLVNSDDPSRLDDVLVVRDAGAGSGLALRGQP
jgi:hypothetical protein